MCDFKVCRICLRNESKFYRFDEYHLKTFYEEVTALPITGKDGLPQYFCYECAAQLYKFHRFKERCYDGHKVLQDMLCSGPITYAGISELNLRKIHKCQHGHLGILALNKRVKTCNIKHTESKEIKVEYKEMKEEVLLGIDYSDGPFSDDDEEYKDPETDPVAEENLEVFIEIKPKNDTATDNNIKEIPDIVINTQLDLNNAKPLLETSKTKMEELEVENKVKLKKEDKRKTATRQTWRTRQTKKRRSKRKKRHDTDYSSDSSDEILSKTKSKKKVSVISPESAKGYKFNKPRDGLRNLAFLNSGFWKKSSYSEEEALKNFEARAQDRKYLNAAYKCTDCYKGFSQMSMLERHIPQRHGDAAGKMACRFCKMRFKSKYFLSKHMKQHYTKYECLRCDLVCSLENTALFHEEYHNGVVRKCPHCDREFKHLSTFYTHLRTHRSAHMCARCGESFVSELGLRLHRKAKHSSVADPQPKVLEDNLYCDTCQIKFVTKDAYDKHLSHSAMHTDLNKVDDSLVGNLLADEEELGGGERKDENTAQELHRRRSRVEKTLSAVRKSYLTKKASRTSKKPTTCHHCGRHFETQSACMKHHLAVHPRTSFFSPKERVICEICGASLAPGSVASHINQHTRSKMYTCDTCGRSFTTSTMLRTHMVTHTGEKKFACTLCEKRFTQNGSLSLHYRTFHLKQPYPKRNRTKKIDKPNIEGFNGKEE